METIDKSKHTMVEYGKIVQSNHEHISMTFDNFVILLTTRVELVEVLFLTSFSLVWPYPNVSSVNLQVFN